MAQNVAVVAAIFIEPPLKNSAILSGLKNHDGLAIEIARKSRAVL